eukprot:m.12835 g.12835  ORF g.12835 m.12835 type:complete len:159 (+) comp4739_c0_seq1:118-594(+)
MATTCTPSLTMQTRFGTGHKIDYSWRFDTYKSVASTTPTRKRVLTRTPSPSPSPKQQQKKLKHNNDKSTPRLRSRSRSHSPSTAQKISTLKQRSSPRLNKQTTTSTTNKKRSQFSTGKKQQKSHMSLSPWRRLPCQRNTRLMTASIHLLRARVPVACC